MRSYKKLALLAFIATACLTTNVRAEDESIVDTIVEDAVVSDGASEYVDTTTEAVVDTETVEESTESTKEEEEEEVVESIEETPEPVVEEDAVETVSEEVTGLKSKISEITDKLKSKISKQDAKKIAAFGIGAWGTATGVGWIVDKFGKSAE
jgi:polyhydroxyalkanoate synthesis regulator phasin